MLPFEEDKGEKREQVRDMFDGIAPRYDALNHLLSLGIDRGWRRRAVKLIKGYGPSRILDLAAGTGDMAILEARKMPGVTVTAADLSEGMLAVAQEKIAERGLSERITTLVAEAEALPFAEGSFDAVSVAFGVRNFHNIAGGLSEMYRVLGFGGAVCIVEFSIPRGWFFGPLFRFYFHRILPLVGGLVSKDKKAYGYLPSSVDEFPAPAEFLQMMREAGFTYCVDRPLTGGVAHIYTGLKR